MKLIRKAIIGGILILSFMVGSNRAQAQSYSACYIALVQCIDQCNMYFGWLDHGTIFTAACMAGCNMAYEDCIGGGA